MPSPPPLENMLERFIFGEVDKTKKKTKTKTEIKTKEDRGSPLKN